MSGLLSQIQSFLLTTILGVVAGMVFQFYQLLVRQARLGRYSLYLVDFILWLLMILVIFLAMLMINQGEMRIYVLVALLTGIIIYYHYLGARLEAPISRIARFTISAFSFLGGGVKRPFVALRGGLRQMANRWKRPPNPDDPSD